MRWQCLLNACFQGKVQVSPQVHGRGLISEIVYWSQDFSALVFLSVLFMCGSCNDKGSNLLAASLSLLLYYLYHAVRMIKRGSVPKVTHYCLVYSSMKYAQEEAFKSLISALTLKGQAAF